MKKLSLFLFMVLFAVSATYAQRTVGGTVVDQNNEPLIGANILLKGTTDGVVTDLDGNFSVIVPDGVTTLVVSYTGYETLEVDLGSQTTYGITLAENAVLAEEVVVVGYRTSSRPKSNVSTQLVSSQTIESRPNASVVQTLQGQVAGLNITTSSGQPGSNSTIQLRGVNSINGNTEPLFIIDGIPVDEDNFRSINPNNIESISVLKDAGATAIYGNRGANGVIVMTTKAGKFNSGLKIDYTAQVSKISRQSNGYNLSSAQDALRLESLFGSGRGADILNYTNDPMNNITFEDSLSRVEGTDWLDVFLREPIAHNHNLTISTGANNFASSTTFGFLNQEGIVVDSKLERYSIANKINLKSNNSKFNMTTTLNLNYSSSNEPNSIGSGAINRNYILGAYSSVPYISLDEYVDGRGLLSPLSFSNTPLFLYDRLLTYVRYENEIKAIGGVNLSYEIMDGLSVSSSLGGEFTDQNLTRAEGPESFNALLFAESGNETPGFQQQGNTRVFAYNFLNSVSYSRTLADLHSINVGLYSEYYRGFYDTFSFFQNGLDPRTFSPGDGSGFIPDNSSNDFFANTVTANKLLGGLFSYFGSIDYDYDSKYGLGVTVRRDASYRFAESNRWGTFYSVSARWNINEESFMESSPFKLLKLRASFGRTGNQRIVDSGGFLNSFGGPDLTESFFATGNGYAGQLSLGLSQIGNTTLRWETVEQLNVGVDFEVFNSRLRGQLDYYQKTTIDLFQSKPISAINATTSQNANVGSLKNSGFDIFLAYDVLKSRDGLNLGVTFNTNYNKQEIIDLPTPDGTIQSGNTIQREGGILGEYHVYEYAGINPVNGNLLFLDSEGNLSESPSPDNDRVMTEKNIYPDFQGGFGLNVDFKGIYLDLQFNYVIGVYKFDFDLNDYYDPTAIGQFRLSKDLLDRAWTEPGDITDIPSLFATNLDADGASDRYLKNADYLRLRFVRLGYNLPNDLLGSIGLRKLGVFVNAENMLTFSSWRGFDVESRGSQRDYPSPKIISVGLDIGF